MAVLLGSSDSKRTSPMTNKNVGLNAGSESLKGSDANVALQSGE